LILFWPGKGETERKWSSQIKRPREVKMRIGDMKIRIGACGVACEVCEFFNKGVCPGCYPGTDEAAPARLEYFSKVYRCPALDCAIKKKQDYCISCDKFPCDVHYKNEMPYSKGLLDGLKELKGFLERGEVVQ
jgi:hypothetical protein